MRPTSPPQTSLPPASDCSASQASRAPRPRSAALDGNVHRVRSYGRRAFRMTRSIANAMLLSHRRGGRAAPVATRRAHPRIAATLLRHVYAAGDVDPLTGHETRPVRHRRHPSGVSSLPRRGLRDVLPRRRVSDDTPRRRASQSISPVCMLVLTNPGHMALTRMPFGTSSRARACVQPEQRTSMLE